MEKETKFKSFEAFLKDAKTRRDISGLKPAKNASGDHVEVSPEEQKYHNYTHGHYNGVPSTGAANPTLGNVKGIHLS